MHSESLLLSIDTTATAVEGLRQILQYTHIHRRVLAIVKRNKKHYAFFSVYYIERMLQPHFAISEEIEYEKNAS